MDSYRRLLTLVCLCLLVATGGCFGAQQSDAPTDSDVDDRPVDEKTTDTEDQSDESSTEPGNDEETDDAEEQLPPVDPDNPYQKPTLTVSVNQSVPDRNMLPVVNESLAYWENNSERYTGYPIQYKLLTNATAGETDLHIRFRETIDTCDVDDDKNITVGCAPIIESESDVPWGSAIIDIRSDYTAHYTNETIIHELGHSLGLEHGEKPGRLMAPSFNSSARRQAIRVHYELSKYEYKHAEEKRQIEESVAYINRSFDTWLEGNKSVTFVESSEDADLLINLTYDESDCSAPGSCIRIGDDQPHLYTDQAEIVVVQSDEEAVGWHVATNWLLYYVPYEEQPEIFSDPEPGEAFEDWWEDDPRP